MKNACILLWCCFFAPLIYGLFWNPFFEKINWPCYGVLLQLWHMCYILPHTVFFWFLSFFACFWTKSPYTTMFFFWFFWGDFLEKSPKKKISIGMHLFYVIENLKVWCIGFIKAHYTTSYFMLQIGMPMVCKSDTRHGDFFF